MKRDMDLVRQILLKLEEVEENGEWVFLEIDGVGETDMSGHIHMMDEAGLIEAIDLSTLDGSEWAPKRITWQGHEFLDAIRSQTVWEKVKKVVKERTGGLALGALEAYARYHLGQMMGLPPEATASD